jgi:hypothetical protein
MVERKGQVGWKARDDLEGFVSVAHDWVNDEHHLSV